MGRWSALFRVGGATASNLVIHIHFGVKDKYDFHREQKRESRADGARRDTAAFVEGSTAGVGEK